MQTLLLLIVTVSNTQFCEMMLITMCFFCIENVLDLSFFTTSTISQTDDTYSINVTYSASDRANTFNCRLNDQKFSQC